MTAHVYKFDLGDLVRRDGHLMQGRLKITAVRQGRKVNKYRCVPEHDPGDRYWWIGEACLFLA